MGDTNIVGPLWKQIDDYVEAIKDVYFKSGQQLRLPADNIPSAPTIAFGNGDSGFHSYTDDVISIAIDGVMKWYIGLNYFKAAVSGGPMLSNVVASNIIPTLIPNRIDENTGIGTPGPDQISFIVGGLEGAKISEVGGALTMTIRDVSEYANNAAAILAGLWAGAVYRTGDDVKIVH